MASRPWQHLYGRRWKAERAVFLVANPVCVGVVRGRRCGDLSRVVDHKVPHKGDERLFWDQSNWQALCQTCHNAHKQRLERSGRVLGCDERGTPFRLQADG